MTDQQPIDQDAVKLAACPFCGERQLLRLDYKVWCQACRAYGPAMLTPDRDIGAAWNRRASPPVREGWQPLNLNDTVMVRLTDIGRAAHAKRHADLFAPYGDLLPYTPPTTDADGWSEFQLWSLMQDFGHVVGMGMQVPFETTIRVQTPPPAASVSPGMSEANEPKDPHPPQGEAEMREALECIAHVMSEMVSTPVDTEAANAWAMALQAVTDIALAALTGRGKGDE